MNLTLLLFAALSLTATPTAVAPPVLDVRFVQAHPVPPDPARFERSRGQTRAVVLIHGLRLRLVREKVERADFSGWQKPGSKVVQALAADADVFAFAYSQNVPVDAVAQAPALRENVRRLRAAGYAEVVLVGHSAGGLVARQLVEDYPDAGVTKVIQLCSPNAGCGYAKLDWLCQAQQAFVDSLGKATRRRCLRERGDRPIPAGVQFVCVVGSVTGVSDLVVSEAAQWPKDLRDQGVPAVRLWTGHFWVIYNRTDAQKIAELVRADHPRWDQSKVAAMKKKLLGD